jgi:hypothetical protein
MFPSGQSASANLYVAVEQTALLYQTTLLYKEGRALAPHTAL